MTIWKRAFALLLGLCLLLLAACGEPAAPEPTATAAPTVAPTPSPEPTPDPASLPQRDYHTLNLSTSELPLCWNPHMWESTGDHLLLSATSSPLVSLDLTTEADGSQQVIWRMELAESVEDVTAEFASEVEGDCGLVWRITLNPDACWNDAAHTPITADSYLYSMQALLDPEMQNYRSVDFRSGAAALLGAEEYYHSGQDGWEENETAAGIRYPYESWCRQADGNFTAADGTALFFSLMEPLSCWLDGHSFRDYYLAGYVPEEVYAALAELGDEAGYVPVTEESIQLLYGFTGSDSWGRESPERLASYVVFRSSWPVVSWEQVGLRKEDTHSLLYFCRAETSEFDLLYALTTPFLVYEPLYEAGKFTYGGRLYTDYGSSLDSSMSCGPYALTETEGAVFTLERNESWFGYRDGAHSGEFETDKIQLRVQQEAEQAAAFQDGSLDLLISGTAADAGQTLWIPDGAVYRFFFVTDAETLENLQAAEGSDVNKTCLSNAAFREAFSLALDRSALAETESGCRSALGLIGQSAYDTLSSAQLSRYRGSEAGLRAICRAYGADDGSLTVAEAAKRCTGYDVERARYLFQLACGQLTEAGSLSDEMRISLNCAVAEAELTEAHKQQNRLVQQFLEEATAGTGLEGRITITFCALPDCYSAVPAGEIEMGFGAWAAAAGDPYSLLRCYCDPSYVTIQESCGFDPAHRLTTLLLEDRPVTMTFAQWCESLLSGGEYFDDAALRRTVLAGLEEALLREYACIPVYESGETLLCSRKLSPAAEVYDPLCGFGGLRRLGYAFDDAAWAELCP